MQYSMPMCAKVGRLKLSAISVRLSNNKLIIIISKNIISINKEHVGDHRLNYRIKYFSISSNHINIEIIVLITHLLRNWHHNITHHSYLHSHFRQQKIFQTRYLNKTEVVQQSRHCQRKTQ